MKELLTRIYEIECIQLQLRVSRQWEAARSLDSTIDILRKEYELKVVIYENTYK